MTKFLSQVDVKPEELEEMKDMVRNNEDAVKEYASMLNPNILGLEDKKLAILTCLCSKHDTETDRWRVHSLIYGPPGVGKSKMITWIRDYLDADYASKRTTEVGLTGSMAHKKLKPGKLPKNHRGVLCIDEIDKFSKKDREGLLESMSDGTVTFSGAGVDESLPANTTVVCTANKRDKLSDKLQSRFDFRIGFDYYSRDVAERILENKFKDEEEKQRMNEQAGRRLQKYVKAARNYEISISESEELCEDVIKKWWDMEQILKGNFNPRNHIDRFLRVGGAHAKMNFRDPKPIDFAKAIEMLTGKKMPALRRFAENAD